MRLLRVRAIQLLILVGLVLLLPPKRAEASEAACYAICLYDDWACIFATGHPADPCGYDVSTDICTLGACTLPPAP